MSDAIFDGYCKRLVKEWNDLSIERKFVLGSVEEIATSGYHIKVSTLAEGSLIAYFTKNNLLLHGQRIVRTKNYRFNKKFNFRWLPCTAFTWEKSNEINMMQRCST